MRAAIYARYSPGPTQKEESIDAQLRANRAHCQRKGHTIVKEYIDEAESGRFDDRADFQNMIRDAKSRLFDVVVFHKIDRNARNEYDYYFYKGQLKKLGIKLEYAEQQIDDSAEGQMMETMLVGMAAYYSRNLAREVLKGLKENAYKAKFNGGTAPFGYRVVEGQYVIHEAEAAAVRFIFEKYLEGWAYYKIAEELDARGYRRPSTGEGFSLFTVRWITTNPVYIGTYCYGKSKRNENGNKTFKGITDVITIENALPAIIDRETWDKAQEKRKTNKTRAGAYKAKGDYLLSGLAYCGDCGTSYVGHGSYHEGTEKKGYGFYMCGKRARKAAACRNRMVQKELLETAVLDRLCQFMRNHKAVEALAEKLNADYRDNTNEAAKELSSLEKEKQQVTKRISNLLNTMEEGRINPAVKQRLDEHTTRKAQIDARITELQKTVKRFVITKNDIPAIMAAFEQMVRTESIEGRKKLFQAFVKRVEVVNNPSNDFAIEFSLPASWGHE